MIDRRTNSRLRALVALAAVTATAAALGLTGVASAQSLPPTATAVASCDAAEGFIIVNITDEDPYTYDVIVDGEAVAADRTDTDEGTDPEVIGPLADGTYAVEVIWNDDDATILDEDVVVDCTLDATPLPAPEPRAAAVQAEPTFTG